MLTVIGHQRIGARYGFLINLQRNSFLYVWSNVQDVWRPCGKRHHKEYINLTVKHPLIQMVLGAISAGGTTAIHILTPGMTLNEAKWIIVLKEMLQLLVSVHQCNIFLHDGAPCHKSKIMKNFFGETNIRLLDWSRNWPDLNTTGNL